MAAHIAKCVIIFEQNPGRNKLRPSRISANRQIRVLREPYGCRGGDGAWFVLNSCAL